MKITFLVDKHACKTPKNIAIISKSKSITYKDCASITQNIKKYLSNKNIRGKVAILLPISIDYVLLFIALMRLDIIIIPINTYFPQEQILALLDQCDCQFLICKKTTSITNKSITAIHIEDIPFSRNSQNIEIIPQISEINKPTTLIFTSGSSGNPKGVLHSFANHYYSALGSNENIPLKPKNRWLLSLPLYHVAGISIIFRCLVAGATIAIPEKTLEHDINKYEITHISMVMTQLQRLLEKNIDLTKLQHILLGGSAISLSLIKQALSKNLPIYTSYGSTEMSSQIATSKKITKTSQALEAKILSHRQVMINNNGEILVKGETLFIAYLKDKKQIQTPNDWFSTGDYGYLSKEKYLKVLGRKDHMFISGGENIHPQEIEQHLCALENIKMAIVVPIKNKEYGKRPIAFIDGVFDEEDIKQKLKSKIASFKIPEYFLPWPKKIPTKGIKIDRNYFIELGRTFIAPK